VRFTRPASFLYFYWPVNLTLSRVVQEIFGPVLSVYVYPDRDYKEVLNLVDNTSPFALTGAVFAQDK